RVEGNGDDPGFDGSPEQVEEGRAVVHHHEQAIARAQPKAQQSTRAARDIGGQLRVGDVTVNRAYRNLGRSTFGDMAVDEWNRNVEGRRKAKCGRRRGGVELDRIALHL